MIKNYLKIAWRNLLKHKVFSLINILGLSIGMATCTIIFLYVHHELTYDQYNKKADRILRITASLLSPDNDLRLATAPALITTTLKRDLPEVEETARLLSVPVTIKRGEQLTREQDFYNSEQSIFSVFDFVFVEGSISNALKEPNSVVINQTMAGKLFGNAQAVGKTLVCNDRSLLITGVFEDRPYNSDIKIKGLMAGDFYKETKWLDDLNSFSFVLCKGKPDLKLFAKKLQSISATYVQPELNAAGATAYKLEFVTEMLKDVHFSKDKLGDNPKGERQYSVIFSLLAVFVLLIALLNYINLTTARSFERAREVGIRKVSGATAFQLIRQFLFESFLLIIISWIAGSILIRVGLPFVNRLLETRLAVDWGTTLLFGTGVLILSFLLAGIYPAFIMSSYKPVTVLKGRWQKSFKGIWLRKSVTITQFAITAALIMGTTVIYQQMKHLRNMNLGYNKDHLMAVYLPSDSTLEGPLRAFQNDLKTRPEVVNLTSGSRLALEGLWATSALVENEGKKKEFLCNFFGVDENYFDVFQISLVEGRNFSDSIPTDKTDGILVNEAFVRSMGWKSGIGKTVDIGRKTKIIGVVKDYSYKSLHNIVEPLGLVYNKNSFLNTTTIKINPKNFAVVETLFKKHFPSLYFDYAFFDDMLNRYYRQDEITMSLFNQFTILAIFISCLGLYGLVSLVTVQRTKEIGVRKVLGATISQLFSLLSKDFLILIVISLAIAIPLTALAMHNWLKGYPYHINLNWVMFVVPVITTIAIALIVISREIIKASLVNPVKSLKTE